MTKSFGDKPTEALFGDRFVRELQGVARSAKRKLEMLSAASRLHDLLVLPSNRLEKLQGNLSQFYSIHINDQWRITFKWINRHAHEVRVTDYH